LVEQGQVEEGIAQMQKALATWQATGTEMHRPDFHAFLAEACGKVGRTEEGLTLLAEALATVERTGERCYEAELYRLRGELTLAQSSVQHPASSVPDPRSLTPEPQGEAEACFLKAIEIAQLQQAKSLELRAVMSVSRLWQNQGKKAEAHHMLSKIYNWFTEGFDTKDLQEAQTLLEELS